jgi:hypothetical protein
MITSGVVFAPLLPHHRRVKPETRHSGRLCRGPASGRGRLMSVVLSLLYKGQRYPAEVISHWLYHRSR